MSLSRPTVLIRYFLFLNSILPSGVVHTYSKPTSISFLASSAFPAALHEIDRKAYGFNCGGELSIGLNMATSYVGCGSLSTFEE
jgi:hypothetical protein